jgi:hypothetical protein
MCHSSAHLIDTCLSNPKLLCIASVLPYFIAGCACAHASPKKTTFINRLLCHMGEGEKDHHHHQASYVLGTHPHTYTCH